MCSCYCERTMLSHVSACVQRPQLSTLLSTLRATLLSEKSPCSTRHRYGMCTVGEPREGATSALRYGPFLVRTGGLALANTSEVHSIPRRRQQACLAPTLTSIAPETAELLRLGKDVRVNFVSISSRCLCAPNGVLKAPADKNSNLPILRLYHSHVHLLWATGTTTIFGRRVSAPAPVCSASGWAQLRRRATSRSFLSKRKQAVIATCSSLY